MAKSKSTKANRTETSNKEQANIATPASLPEAKAVVAEAATPAVKTETKSQNKIVLEPRKFEIAKSEARKNLVPINLEDEIRRRAYELYEQRGRTSGSEAEDWLAAESEVLQRYHQHSA